MSKMNLLSAFGFVAAIGLSASLGQMGSKPGPYADENAADAQTASPVSEMFAKKDPRIQSTIDRTAGMVERFKKNTPDMLAP